MLSARQQQILEASIELIDKHGIQGFTIKNLSKKIQISEPGIYRHFESKFDILDTIMDIFKQRIQDYHKFLNDPNNKPEVRIRNFFDTVLKAFCKNPAFASVIFSEEIFQNEEKIIQKIREIQEMNAGIMRELILEIQAGNGQHNNIDPDLINSVLFGSVRFLVRQWKANKYDFDLRAKGNELIGVITNTMIIRPANQ